MFFGLGEGDEDGEVQLPMTRADAAAALRGANGNKGTTT